MEVLRPPLSRLLDRFWVPVWFRFGLVALVALISDAIFGLTTGLAVALAGVCVLIALQLFYLKRVIDWVRRPDALDHVVELPDGFGAWEAVFAELRRARRRDDKQRDEVSETLNRFIEASSALPDGIVILDRGGLIEWCNPSAERHFGLDLGRDGGFLITNLVRQPAFTEYLMRADFHEPLTLPSATGQTTLSVQMLPFQVTRRMVLSRDITPYLRVEAMRRDFIANVSHELRTPLTVIGGYLEQMIDQPELPASQVARVEAIMLDQTQRMKRLIEDLLVLSKLETRTTPDHEDSFPVTALIDALVEEARALSHGVHAFDVQAEPGTLFGSMDELRSAFGNLLSNAVRHTPSGSSIHITFGPHPEGVQFSVTDSGPGIAPEHLPPVSRERDLSTR